MKKTTQVVLVLAALCASPVFAGPFHDCNTNPGDLEADVHGTHGKTSCGNATSSGAGTDSDCMSNCMGSNCPLGEWETSMQCLFNSSGTNCEVQGSIVCNGAPRSYHFNCPGDSGNPVVQADRAAVTCDTGLFNYECDCTTSETYWSIYCTL